MITSGPEILPIFMTPSLHDTPGRKLFCTGGVPSGGEIKRNCPAGATGRNRKPNIRLVVPSVGLRAAAVRGYAARKRARATRTLANKMPKRTLTWAAGAPSADANSRPAHSPGGPLGGKMEDR